MPMFKVYVGNLDPRTTVETLKPYFEPFGDAVDEIVLVTDKEGQPRGFAIVLFRDPQRGQLAIETLTGKRINGREIQINESVKKSKRVQAPDKGPRNSPLGPRAFPRPGGGFRAGGSRPGGRPGPGGGRPGFGGSAGGGGTFNRNPRRAPGQPAGEAGSGGAPAPGPGSRPIGGGGFARPASRPLGGSGAPGGRPPVPGGGGTQSRPLGSGGRPGVPPAGSRPLSSRPPAPPVSQPPAPPAGGTADGEAAAKPVRPKAAKKKPPADG